MHFWLNATASFFCFPLCNALPIKKREERGAAAFFSNQMYGRSAATDSNRQRRFGKPSARSGPPAVAIRSGHRHQKVARTWAALYGYGYAATNSLLYYDRMPLVINSGCIQDSCGTSHCQTDSSGWVACCEQSTIVSFGPCDMVWRMANCVLRPAGVSSQTKIGRIYHRDESLIRRDGQTGPGKIARQGWLN